MQTTENKLCFKIVTLCIFNNSIRRQPFFDKVWKATSRWNGIQVFIILFTSVETVTTLPCESPTPAVYFMPVLPDVQILTEWQKHFLARYTWKVIINLLSILFTEGVTANQQNNAVAHRSPVLPHFVPPSVAFSGSLLSKIWIGLMCFRKRAKLFRCYCF